MIFISTAMYCEASPFIERLQLKKDLHSHKFQIFKNEEVVLIISGVGKVQAAIAITYLFSKYKPKKSDLLINVGVCGAQNKGIEIGSAFICNKIIEQDSQKTFYPDMLFKHPFSEATIETVSRPINNSCTQLIGQLADMEASGVYEAAIVFMQSHQIFIIKIVSDYLTDNINQDKILKLIENKTENIVNWIKKLNQEFSNYKEEFSAGEQELMQRLADNLKLSVAMKNELKQLLIYYKLQHSSCEGLIKQYLNVECKSKEEGKKYFAEIKQKII